MKNQYAAKLHERNTTFREARFVFVEYVNRMSKVSANIPRRGYAFLLYNPEVFSSVYMDTWYK